MTINHDKDADSSRGMTKVPVRDESSSSLRWSKGYLQRVPRCPACGSLRRAKRMFCRRDDAKVFPDIWCMATCLDCGSMYLDPRPDPPSLRLAYAEHYYTHQIVHSDKKTGWLAKLVNGYLAWRFGMTERPHWRVGAWFFRAIRPLRLKLDVYGRNIPIQWVGDCSKTILDVGCGNGDFLLRAEEMGLRAMGVEPDPQAVKVCIERGLDVVPGEVSSLALYERRFDFITLNHVIEHVEHPLSLLRHLYELLHSDGWLWLALPNPQALGVGVFGKGWSGLHPPFHLLIPSQQVLIEWLRSSGFVDVRFICRGAVSPGLWRESCLIAKREGCLLPSWIEILARIASTLLGSFTPRWSEETIIMARRSQ